MYLNWKKKELKSRSVPVFAYTFKDNKIITVEFISEIIGTTFYDKSKKAILNKFSYYGYYKLFLVICEGKGKGKGKGKGREGKGRGRQGKGKKGKGKG